VTLDNQSVHRSAAIEMLHNRLLIPSIWAYLVLQRRDANQQKKMAAGIQIKIGIGDKVCDSLIFCHQSRSCLFLTAGRQMISRHLFGPLTQDDFVFFFFPWTVESDLSGHPTGALWSYDLASIPFVGCPERLNHLAVARFSPLFQLRISSQGMR
jgi:hypothetical protein